MNEQELIAAVKAANSKDELEALVKGELGIDLDKRRGLESLRADVLAGLGATQQEQQAVGEPMTVQHPVEELVVDTATPASAAVNAPTEGTDLELEPELPELGEEDIPVLTEPAPRNRLLRNRENGREFIWTPELAKLPHMEEV